MEPQKPSNSPGSGPEVLERQRVAEERAVQRVCSWIVQNEMKGVLGRVSAGTAGRIVDSANPREIKSLREGCVHCSKDRENTASVMREHKFLDGNRGNLCVKEFGWNSTPPVQEERRVDTRDKWRETTWDCREHE